MTDAGDSVVVEERRGNTVSISRPAASFIATISAALVTGITVVLWNLVLTVNSLTIKVENLIEYGPKAGDRFTKQDALEMRNSFNVKFDTLSNEVEAHLKTSGHPLTEQRINQLDREVDGLAKESRRLLYHRNGS